MNYLIIFALSPFQGQFIVALRTNSILWFIPGDGFFMALARVRILYSLRGDLNIKLLWPSVVYRPAGAATKARYVHIPPLLLGSGFPKADSDTPTKYPSWQSSRIKGVHSRISHSACNVLSPTTCDQIKPFLLSGNP